MINLNTIVLPVDFSTRSAGVAAHARILAKQFDATIILVHVMRPFQLAAEGVDVPSTVVLDWYTQQKPILLSKLEEFAKIYLQHCKVKVVFREGEPATEIIRVAQEEAADVIMISTHGYGPFRRFLLGSVAAKVLSDSPIPVLTGTHIDIPTDEKEHIDNIVIAVDLDERIPELLAAAEALGKQFKASLHVVHASPDDGAGAARYMDPTWRIDVANKLQAQLEDAVADAGVTANVRVIAGEVAKVVRAVSDEVKADLVILGRRRDDSFLGRLRTHSYAIVRESPCPVLSI